MILKYPKFKTNDIICCNNCGSRNIELNHANTGMVIGKNKLTIPMKCNNCKFEFNEVGDFIFKK